MPVARGNPIVEYTVAGAPLAAWTKAGPELTKGIWSGAAEVQVHQHGACSLKYTKVAGDIKKDSVVYKHCNEECSGHPRLCFRIVSATIIDVNIYKAIPASITWTLMLTDQLTKKQVATHPSPNDTWSRFTSEVREEFGLQVYVPLKFVVNHVEVKCRGNVLVKTVLGIPSPSARKVRTALALKIKIKKA